ncbi:MAG: energy-coupling factor transporter ATPase [Clostridiales bacterium]|nr:energy-coupling factor transporter ATPase [Clostridiales bacterium]
MEENIVKFNNVSHTYKSHYDDKPDVVALDGVNMDVRRGEFLAVLGRNGSGKSTLARHMNALLIPQKGLVLVEGIDTSNGSMLWDIRHSVGMVFQNPDNQIVGTIVEEDVAFGPENLGVPPAEIRQRVDEALATVGISEYSKHAPHLLSGGQKQRVAIAGILAMKPHCLVLDEATAMLDPIGRKEVMKVLSKLNREEGITIVHITHHMDEASIADRVIVMENGKIVISGTPGEVFRNVERIKAIGLDVPQVTELLYELNKHGYEFPLEVLTVEQAFEQIKIKLITGQI